MSGTAARDRLPVIIGVGQINDRPSSPEQGLDSLGLMQAALRAADADAGGGWLPRLDSLAVVDQIAFPHTNPLADRLAALLGATPRLCEQTRYPTGDSPILLLNQAADSIASGQITTAAVVGGEALRTAAARAAAGPASPNAISSLAASRTPSLRQRYGLVAPADIYPLYENACRAAWGQSLAEAQAETAQIWSLFSQVAAANPGAWLRTRHSAEQIRTPSPDNRPLAFPYLKLMVANSSVNQGAAFIVTSLANATAHGIAPERMIHVGQGAAAHESDDVLARDRYDRSASMEACLRRTLEMNAVTADEIDFAELYSCFPCVPKMARRIIGWPLDRPATVVGGLTFGGGPIGNYMSHAVVGMVEQLRRSGRCGLLFANGGYASHNHAIILTRTPSLDADRQCYDVQAQADASRSAVPPLVEAHIGAGTIETYTVLYERDASPRFGIVVGRTPAGARFLARVPKQDEAGIAFLTDDRVQPVESAGDTIEDASGDIVWVLRA